MKIVTHIRKDKRAEFANLCQHSAGVPGYDGGYTHYSCFFYSCLTTSREVTNEWYEAERSEEV